MFGRSDWVALRTVTFAALIPGLLTHDDRTLSRFSDYKFCLESPTRDRALELISLTLEELVFEFSHGQGTEFRF